MSEKDQMKLAKEKAKTIVDAAKAKAKVSIDAAKAKAAIMIEKAKAKAKKVLDDAKEKSKKAKARKQTGGLGDEIGDEIENRKTMFTLLAGIIKNKNILDNESDDQIKQLLESYITINDDDHIYDMIKKIKTTHINILTYEFANNDNGKFKELVTKLTNAYSTISWIAYPTKNDKKLFIAFVEYICVDFITFNKACLTNDGIINDSLQTIIKETTLFTKINNIIGEIRTIENMLTCN